MTPAQLLDFAAVFVFALTGGLVASRAQLDIVGFAFVATLTAVGGGTVRDVVLGRLPVFWVADPLYLGVAAAGGLVMFVSAHRMERRYPLLLWLDAVALAIAVAAGVSAAQAAGASLAIIAVMGVATGCLGGLMRDVVCNEVPLVLRQGELYVTAALAGALAAALLAALDAPRAVVLVACATTTFALRAGSLALGWRLPTYDHPPPRQR
ncbi:MAG: trimeric intracellular cation channel family protein [Pseudomonadota bacterium]